MTIADCTLYDVEGVNFYNVTFDHCDLSYVDFTKVVLYQSTAFKGCLLANARLPHTNVTLIDTDASWCDWRAARADIVAVLSEYPSEVPALLRAIQEGHIDGTVYSGPCACLMGTIANARQCNVDDLPTDSERPAELFFLGIRAGDTPETNQFSALAERWVRQWLEHMQAAFGCK